MHADPASRGYASVVRMTSRAKRSHDLVFCGDSGWASLVCSASTGQFRLGAPHPSCSSRIRGLYAGGKSPSLPAGLLPAVPQREPHAR